MTNEFQKMMFFEWQKTRKKEKISLSAFSSFQTMFSKYFFDKVVKSQEFNHPLINILNLLCKRFTFDLWKTKSKLLGYFSSLTLSQTTNFTLFQTERVCRRQFQIWWKWQKLLKICRKHCGKRRNCSLRAISPFPSVFSKDLYCRQVKAKAFFGKGLKATITWSAIKQALGPENFIVGNWQCLETASVSKPRTGDLTPTPPPWFGVIVLTTSCPRSYLWPWPSGQRHGQM